MKNALRSLLLIVFALFILWAMGHYNLINFELIITSLRNAKSFVLATVGVQLIVFFVLLWRYVLIVRAFDVPAKTQDLAAATFVSVALGQWAPGSIAFMEAIRMGLTVRSNVSESVDNVRARLVAASFYDRLLGFIVILSMGFIFTFGLCLWQFFETNWTGHVAALAMLTAFSFFGSIALIALPFISRLNICKRLLNSAHHIVGSWTLLGSQKFSRAMQKLLGGVESFRHVLASGGTRMRRFVPAMLVSALAALLTNVTTYLAAQSLGTPISFLAITAVFPATAMAGLIPMGFAGIGGYQLLSVALLGIFGVTPHAAAGASLMQTAVSLLTSTLLGFVFMKAGFRQIKILKKSNQFA